MSSAQIFDEAHAAHYYDEHFAKLAALRDALHLVTQLALRPLPAQARILVVGAGTGAEILHLAAAFPDWRFTAVDPSGPMLERCRRNVEDAGFTARCQFHQGELDTLGAQDSHFDGATAQLVSQFLVARDARIGFFRAIAERLRPGAPLVVADLAAPALSGELADLWREAWLHAGRTTDEVEGMFKALGNWVAVLPPDDVAELIAAGGFAPPVRCFQAVLIHGWLTRRLA
jgi:tRNA (cmo5U34)-methyltransferase